MRFEKENLIADDKWRSYDINEKRLFSPCGIRVPNLKIIRFSKVFRFRLSFSANKRRRVKPETFSNSSSRLYYLFDEIYVFIKDGWLKIIAKSLTLFSNFN